MSGTAIDQGPKVRSSRVLATQFRDEQDAAAARQRAETPAGHRKAALGDPAPVLDRGPSDLTLLEADALGLVTFEQMRTLKQCHGTPEHEQQAARILELAQEQYRRELYRADMLGTWPQSVRGPLLPGPRGYLVPARIIDRTQALAVRQQLEATALLRDLLRHERQALRALKANGVVDPGAAADVAQLERARLKRLSKAAKRARAAQRGVADARSRSEAEATGAEPVEEVPSC